MCNSKYTPRYIAFTNCSTSRRKKTFEIATIRKGIPRTSARQSISFSRDRQLLIIFYACVFFTRLILPDTVIRLANFSNARDGATRRRQLRVDAAWKPHYTTAVGEQITYVRIVPRVHTLHNRASCALRAGALLPAKLQAASRFLA